MIVRHRSTRSSRRGYPRLLALQLIVVVLLSSLPVYGQTFQGGLRGRVADESGAVIAGASVVLRNEGTNLTVTTASNAEGEFNFPSLDPATYSITVEKQGFKKVERREIVVETQGFHTIDFKLAVGNITQSVDVTDAAPLLDTTMPSAGQALASQQLIALPNPGRNPFLVLARLSPNVVFLGDMKYQRFQDQSGTSQVSVAGSLGYSNNFLIDGIPVTETNNRTSIIPDIEAVQDVKVQANTYDAEMGRSAGGVFNTVLRGGTNDIHGSVLGYVRQPQWAANDFYRNRAGLPRGTQSWRDFGGSFGGPVVIPKLYNGKDKTFFWLTTESYRQKDSASGTTSIPTMLERTGDFSQSVSRLGGLQTIYDPATTTTDASGKTVREPFSGNKIPSSRISKVGQAVAGYYPVPSSAASYYGATNYTYQSVLANRGDQYTGKFSHAFAPWWTATYSYIHYKSIEPGNYILNMVSSPAQARLLRKVDASAVNNTFIINPTTVATIRYGFNRFPNEYRTRSDGFDPVAKLGFPASAVKDSQYLKFPRFDMQTWSPLGAESDTAATVYNSKNLLGDVSKLVGRHSLKVGFAFRHLSLDTIPFGYSVGEFSFSDTFTRQNYQSFDNKTGSDMASLLLGLPGSGYAQTSAKLQNYLRYYAGYIQDSFRVSPKLTLNLGLRYEWETGIADKNNALIVGFDPNAVNPISQSLGGTTVKGTLLYAGLNGNKTSVMDPSKTKFAPRFGMAYMLNDKTTVRGGYGLYWAPVSYGGYNPLGYTQITNLIGTTDGGRTAIASLDNPFPNGFLKPVGNSLGTSVGLGQGVSYIDQNARSPYIHSFSVDMQRVLAKQIVLTTSYIGSRSRRLLIGTGSVNINQLSPDLFSLGSSLYDSVANPFYGHGGTGIIGSATITRAQSLYKFPQFGGIGRLFSDFNHSRYDAFVMKAERRFTGGLGVLTSWTWAKNMDAAYSVASNQNGGSGGPQNAYDLEREYSRALSDVTHRFTFGMNYEMPFGKGRKWLSQSRLLDYAVGGWELNALSTVQSGFPLAIIQSNYNGIMGMAVQRPNATGAAPDSVAADPLYGWINPAAYSLAPAYTFGNVSRVSNLRGPMQGNLDLSLFKAFTVYERLKGQFRAEVMNATNSPAFGLPVTNLSASNFGQVTNQKNFPRLIQFGVRVLF
jgi:hypothetical protein